MGITGFIEGPLWWIVAPLFVLGIAYRVVLALWGLVRKRGWWIPLNRMFVKKPVYVILRYTFHILMVITPIWFGGHIVLWHESRFNWSWTSLPDAWADWFTLIVIAFLVFFVLRRLLVRNIRETSNVSDYALIALVALPFLSGYLLSHGNLESIHFFHEHLLTIHVLSAELMIITALFLFIIPAINHRLCTGCSACGVQCPTEAMEVKEKEGLREFFHNYFLCIACAKCASTCPEEAVTLRHKIAFGRLIQPFIREPLRKVEMAKCRSCGIFIAPVALLNRVEVRQQGRLEYLCNDCKKAELALHICQSFVDRESV